MLISMTGYGGATSNYKDKQIKIELRSLNSRNFNVRLNLPDEFKQKEMEIRRLLSDELLRGKIDFNLTIANEDGSEIIHLDEHSISKYYEKLSGICDRLGAPKENLLPIIFEVSDVVSPDKTALDEESWNVVENCLHQAIDQLQSFRKQEGEALKSDLRQRAVNILSNLDKVSQHEKDRKEHVRKRLKSQLEEFMQKDDVNKDRYEQEVLYYMEKLDITEESVRLRQHCDYFLDVLMLNKAEKGRKLNFISQEIGREINTLGAKANFSEIQHIVVQMKDELEKIKEQVNNVV